MNNMQQFGNERAIRVFISSTFRDMHAEREILAKFVFPQIRQLCASRNVAWGEVDLRWGITDEQTAEGLVLPVCLREIERCRPYFIGILGERYGWVPDEIPSDLLKRLPWLEEHREHSVTELEILHGVMNNPKLIQNAFFYFRDPQYINSIPLDIRDDFLSENPVFAEKLCNLKNRIRYSSYHVRENYRNPEEFGFMVLADFTAMINKRFPDYISIDEPGISEKQKNSLMKLLMNPFKQKQFRPYVEREVGKHCNYGSSLVTSFVPVLWNEKLIDQAINKSAAPILITGEHGIGKSSAITYWLQQHNPMGNDALRLAIGIWKNKYFQAFIGKSSAIIHWLQQHNFMRNDTLRLAIEIWKNKYFQVFIDKYSAFTYWLQQHNFMRNDTLRLAIGRWKNKYSQVFIDKYSAITYWLQQQHNTIGNDALRLAIGRWINTYSQIFTGVIAFSYLLYHSYFLLKSILKSIFHHQLVSGTVIFHKYMIISLKSLALFLLLVFFIVPLIRFIVGSIYRYISTTDYSIYFVGADRLSFDFKHLLYTISKRIELYTPGSFVLLSEEKNTWQEQLDIFRQQMSRFRGHRPLIILIDGIDQLADKDIIPIDWPLRLSLPSNVRIIVTTADHDQADRLGNVGWTTVEVASLDEVTKHQIIKKYLASYGKQLTERQVTCIASAPACSNPRYLVELLEELRLHSDYSTLNQRIEHYVSKESLPALYASILERIEDDFEKSNVSALIIQQFFSFLWAAPEGLTELELRILLGTPTQPLPQIYLSNFTLATERFVQNRRSVLTISDPYFREAIKQRYVSTFEEQQALFCKITIYIQTEEIDFRRLNLLCHCLFGAREWDKLVDLLKDHKTLLLFWKYGKSQLVLYWNRLYNDGNINAKEIYNWNKTSFNPPEEIAIILNWLRNELSSSDIPSSKGFIIPDTPEPKRNTGLAKIISYCNLLWYSIYSPITNIPLKSKYLFELGRDQEAFILIDKFILHPKNFLGSAESVEAYNCIAGILSSFGYNGKAITMLKRGEEIAEECGDIENLPLLYELYMIIIIYYFDNLNDDTEFEYRKNVILEIHNYAKRINNPELLQLCWGTIGDYYRNMKEWKSALEHYHFEEEVCRNHDLSEGLIYAMSEQGDIYYSQEEYEKAFSFFNDAAKICRSLHYNDKLALLMLQMGDSLLLMGELERAEQRYKISLKVYREINENDYECYLLDQLGTIYELSEDLPHALQLWHEEEQLAVDKGDTDSYHDSLQQQLRVYKILDDKIGIQRCENALSQANNQ